jgi:hypothetical protein
LLKKLLLLTGPSLLATALVLELVFRTLIPASDEPFAYYDAAEELLRYDATRHRDGTYTVGALAQQRSLWHVNNCGWNSDIDYLPRESRTLPLVAIIGDSFVEALNVDTDRSLASRLRRRLAGSYDVYSFGMSGAPLSQYLQEARYVRRRFQPNVLVFVLVHNDFHESFRPQSVHSHFLHVREAGAGFAEEDPEPYRPSSSRRILSRSALVRYLWLNLKTEGIRKTLFRARRGLAEAERQPTPAEIPRAVQRATVFLIERIVEENLGSHVLFVTDGPRREIYSRSVAGSDGERYNHLVRAACDGLGCPFLDLTPILAVRYRRDGRRFETPYDRHWDAYGHEVVADAVYDWLSTQEWRARSLRSAATAGSGASARTGP